MYCNEVLDINPPYEYPRPCCSSTRHRLSGRRAGAGAAMNSLAQRIPEERKCPLDRPYGDIVCRDGQLWALTYSEMGPPDSRQNEGPCPHCKPEEWKRASTMTRISPDYPAITERK